MNVVAFNPANPNVVWAGSAQGGIWRSDNRGVSWLPFGDHKGLPNLGVSAIAVASDGTVYLGDGDQFSGANHAVPTQSGGGVWKSTNNGATWQATGTTAGCNNGLSQVVRLAVDTANSEVVWAAAQNGLFRSLDGGACWKQLHTGSISDVAISPSSSSSVFVAGSVDGTSAMVESSTNANNPTPTWSKHPLPAMSSLSADPRVQLALAPSSANVVYALASDGAHMWLIRSDTSTQTWNTPHQVSCSGQCSYGAAVVVDPVHWQQVAYGEVSPHLSNDGGVSFRTIGQGIMHADIHSLVFAPGNPNTLFAGSDGGVSSTPMPAFGTSNGAAWLPKNVGLAIATAEVFSNSPSDSRYAAFGEWDNGTLWWAGPGKVWNHIGGGDGFNATIDAAAPQTVYHDVNAGFGSTFARAPDGAVLGTAPGYVANPYRPGELWELLPAGHKGGAYVAEKANTAGSLQLTCADPAPSAPIGANAADFGPNDVVYVRGFDGTTYRETLAYSHPVYSDCSKGTSAGHVSKLPVKTGQLRADPFDPNSVYAWTVDHAHIQHITFNPTTGQWTAVTVANVPVDSRVFAVDPTLNGVLYMGTDHGLWMGTPQNGGAYHWKQDLYVPDTIVFGIESQVNSSGYTGVLRLSTYGRGIWQRMVTSVAASAWSAASLSQIAGAPQDVVGAPMGFASNQTSTGEANAVYRDTSGDVQLMSVSPGHPWHIADLTQLSLGAPAAASDPFGYQSNLSGQGYTDRIVYRTAGGHVEEIASLANGGWGFHDLTQIAAAPAATGTPMGFPSNLTSAGEANVVYQDTSGHLVWLSVTSGKGWHVQSHGLGALLSDPFGNQTSLSGQGNTARIDWRDTGGHIDEFSCGANYTACGEFDLTQLAGAPTATGNPMGFATDLTGDGEANVVYEDTNGHIERLFATLANGWHVTDLTNLVGAPGANGDPFGYQTDLSGQGHSARIVYLANSVDVEELSNVGNTGWGVEDLTSQAGAPAGFSNPKGYTTNLSGQGPVARVVYANTQIDTGNGVEELSAG